MLNLLRKKGLSRNRGLVPGCRSPTLVRKELWGFGPMAARTENVVLGQSAEKFAAWTRGRCEALVYGL